MIKAGQKVICICDVFNDCRKIWFFTIRWRRKRIVPKMGKIYTCNSVVFNNPHKVWVCSINEVPGTYTVDCFKPAQEDFAESVCEKAIKEAKDEEISIIEETIKI